MEIRVPYLMLKPEQEKELRLIAAVRYVSLPDLVGSAITEEFERIEREALLWMSYFESAISDRGLTTRQAVDLAYDDPKAFPSAASDVPSPIAEIDYPRGQKVVLNRIRVSGMVETQLRLLAALEGKALPNVVTRLILSHLTREMPRYKAVIDAHAKSLGLTESELLQREDIPDHCRVYLD